MGDEFIDAEQYRGEMDMNVSFPMIVLEWIRKMGKISEVEFRGGYFQMTTTKSGEERQIYVQDTREVYCNFVMNFIDTAFPHFDDTMKESLKKYEKELGDLKEKFIEATSIEESIVLGSDYYTNDKDRLLREEYAMQKLSIHRRLYRQLSRFIKRKKYFKAEVYEEEV